jgi:pyruvate,water dikinase
MLSLREAIDAVLARTDADPTQKSALIAQLWQDVAVPGPVGEDVLTAYRRLSDGEDAFVAIRSSAREEDTPGAVRAGEFDTFLFVRGEQALLAHLRRAWSGLWTARAIHDRWASGRDGLGEGGGVLVQRIVWSRVSGVLQTINVAEGRTREMAIDVGLGLGEGVVSGLVTADHVVVSKDEDPDTRPLRFHYVSGDKRERVVFDERRGTGTVRADVLSHQRLRPALEYTELVELVRAATRLEAAYGYPLDIEFGLEGARLFVLQVRPVPGTQAVWRETIERRRSTSRDGARARPPDAPTSRPERSREAPP